MQGIIQPISLWPDSALLLLEQYTGRESGGITKCLMMKNQKENKK